VVIYYLGTLHIFLSFLHPYLRYQHSNQPTKNDFPIDLLKLDRSFVQDICHNKSDLAIIKAIINMATALDINTLAEGIENEDQANVLNMLSCQYSQGFLFSKAINAKQFQ